MNFADVDKLLGTRKVPLAVCMPEDIDTVSAAHEAANQGFVECIFVGNKDIIKGCLDKAAPGFNPEIIHCDTPEDAAFKSVELIRQNRASALMKGSISTPVLLKAVLNSETGIKKSGVLSHVLVFEWENSLRFLTDGGMLTHPSLEEKIEMINNCKALARKLGVEVARVAVLSSVEKVNPKIQSTIDAAVLAKMGDRKQFGADCIVDGPLALDNAISLESAHHKGLFNEVVGRADILIAPDIDTGNVLGKILLYFAKTQAGGLILGAQCPVVLLSRSDDKQTRMNSIKLALAAGKM
ncbi:MAG TPA: phosphate butyryltransferase [Candidatus Riflebacteria bacterium]|jgi:phosphotransacetylase|nr:MAG: phosphate butyryltransferase [Candidatus Riflebacteria bacterium HGW-Riflebacteria-1]PKL42714.1 MAG: phosphate butyryltransferase [Candidatus Riflebacteria bacterium HGW-Riflebacteria-2]HAE39508.1 phosphate butyryltransferase [Candidatus Riflebacteria bacterium]